MARPNNMEKQNSENNVSKSNSKKMEALETIGYNKCSGESKTMK